MNWNIDQVREAVHKVLKDGKWPVYETQDDNGLEKEEYIEFVCDVLNHAYPVDTYRYSC